LGKDDLIAGFQEGISQMRAKGHYKLVIPSSLAYGETGNEIVPPNETLIFEIDVLSVE
jgi:FKBP-type peptidyl-prolyl cis-trans isomerase